MNLDELRKLAEAAKAWLPMHWCSFNEASWNGRCGYESRPACASCAGSLRASIWVEAEVDLVLRGCRRGDALLSREHADLAALVESLFGAPGPVAAFADGVRRFVEEQRK